MSMNGFENKIIWMQMIQNKKLWVQKEDKRKMTTVL
jgi:hypothetical protein